MLTRLQAVAQFYLRFLPSFSAIGYHVRRLAWSPLTTRFDGQHWLVTGSTSPPMRR
jgi:dehydrogenase/reductase SDR family protein 12